MGDRFYLSDHQGKGLPYARALEAAGYERVGYAGEADLKMAFYDQDSGARNMGFRNGLSYLRGQGVPVFLYPHSARPFVQYDGIITPWPHTRCMITIAPGHAEIMQLIQYPCPVAVCGWALCEQKPWKAIPIPKRKPLTVLFGPIHPNGNGWLSELDKRQNAAVYELLLQVPNIRLIVRHVKRVDLSGLWKVPGVQYVLANPDGSTAEIDRADVVVGHQTMAYLAIARGKPVIMFGDQSSPHSGNHPALFQFARRYDLYRNLLKYPLEAEDARNGMELRSMLEQAMSEDVAVQWRDQFIGKPFEPVKFTELIQSYL
jgi:hypothetical protein